MCKKFSNFDSPYFTVSHFDLPDMLSHRLKRAILVIIARWLVDGQSYGGSKSKLSKKYTKSLYFNAGLRVGSCLACYWSQKGRNTIFVPEQWLHLLDDRHKFWPKLLGFKVPSKFVLCGGFWSNVHLVGDIFFHFSLLKFNNSIYLPYDS